MAELAALKPRHRAVAQLVLAGWTHQAIADELGYAPSYVAVITGSPLFQEILAGLQDAATAEAMRYLEKEALRSAETIVEIRDTAKHDATRLKASNDILDRVLAKRSRSETLGKAAPNGLSARPIQLTVEEIHEMKLVIQEDDADKPRFRRETLPGPPPPRNITPAPAAPATIQTIEQVVAALEGAE